MERIENVPRFDKYIKARPETFFLLALLFVAVGVTNESGLRVVWLLPWGGGAGMDVLKWIGESDLGGETSFWSIASGGGGWNCRGYSWWRCDFVGYLE